MTLTAVLSAWFGATFHPPSKQISHAMWHYKVTNVHLLPPTPTYLLCTTSPKAQWQWLSVLLCKDDSPREACLLHPALFSLLFWAPREREREKLIYLEEEEWQWLPDNNTHSPFLRLSCWPACKFHLKDWHLPNEKESSKSEEQHCSPQNAKTQLAQFTQPG